MLWDMPRGVAWTRSRGLGHKPNRGAPNAGLLLNCTEQLYIPIPTHIRTRRCQFMSSLKVESLHREFFYNGTHIPDPAPNLTVEQVREILTPTYPELATATLVGPEDTGGALRYTFSRAIGSKG